MSNVIRFPGHKRERCALFCCSTCGGAEASLPTHCPGERMDSITLDAVQTGAMDYVHGEWRWYGYTVREVFDG